MRTWCGVSKFIKISKSVWLLVLTKKFTEEKPLFKLEEFEYKANLMEKAKNLTHKYAVFICHIAGEKV